MLLLLPCHTVLFFSFSMLPPLEHCLSNFPIIGSEDEKKKVKINFGVPFNNIEMNKKKKMFSLYKTEKNDKKNGEKHEISQLK